MNVENQIKEKFDGLADDYELYRPRYPLALIETLLKPLQDRSNLTIVDVGAGTGIALEHIVDLLGTEHHYHAIDISIDMIQKGQQKFPNIDWHHGKAEEVISKFDGVDLLLAAQSFQWMDRPKLLSLIKQQLKPKGVLGVIQNNRNFQASPFLDQYERLLEEMSPGYSRYYRRFDFKSELVEGLQVKSHNVALHTYDWVMAIPSSSFVGMSRSSTQAQRAIVAKGDEFIDRLVELIKQYERNGHLEIKYQCELYMYSKMS